MIARQLTRVRRSALRARKRIGRNSVILLYHRVAELPSDPWALAVSPRHFRQHLEVLQRRGALVRLEDLAQKLSHGSFPRKAVAVTFDDGYVDTLSCAAPLLERYEVPATVFVATGGLGDPGMFWWDQLERLILRNPSPLPETLRLDVGGHLRHWSLDTSRLRPSLVPSWRAWETPPTQRHALFASLYELMQPQPSGVRRSLLACLHSWAEIEQTNDEPDRGMSREEASALNACAMIDIAPHTETHSMLSALTRSEQRAEILGSRDCIDALTGRPASTFAYPFGRPGDFTSETIELVRDAGFAVACANVPGTVRPGSDLFALPRMFVQDWDGDEFDRRLTRWLDG